MKWTQKQLKILSDFGRINKRDINIILKMQRWYQNENKRTKMFNGSRYDFSW